MENKHRLELIGITYNQIESGVYALILQESGTSRRIPIIIGYPEAQAIECKLQEVATPRPLTHDTMSAALGAFGITLKEVMIHKLPTGVFAADLILTDGIREETVDSRSSDAVALAIRTGAPIYTTGEVLEEAGFYADQNPRISQPDLRSALSAPIDNMSAKSIDELQEEMNKAVENENYEEAARIKGELERRMRKDNREL